MGGQLLVKQREIKNIGGYIAVGNKRTGTVAIN